MGLTRRSWLSLFTLTGAGGFLVGDTASAIAGAAQSGGTQSRVGKVVSVNGSTLTVNVGGGSLVDMPYLLGIRVVPGDSVAIVQNGASWYVAGPFAGVPADNLVANGSFEDSAGNPSTASWDFQVIDNSAGTPVWSVADVGNLTGGQYVAGTQAAFIDCNMNGVGTTMEGKLRSAPIAVRAGEQYGGSVFAGCGSLLPGALTVSGGVAFVPIVQVAAAIEFYTLSTDAASTSSVTFGPIPPVPFQLNLLAVPLATVPVGPGFMRLTLDFSVNDVGANFYTSAFDRAILRKIRNLDGTLAF